MSVGSPRTVENTVQQLNNQDAFREIDNLERRVARGKTAAPTVNDDFSEGYDLGTLWIDETNDEAYILLDFTKGAAVWKQIT